MGEMADFLLAQFDDDEFYWDGLMYDEETDSFYGHGRRTKPLICKFCGKKDLYWTQVSLSDRTRKWVMFEKYTSGGGGPHFCPNHKMPLKLLKYFANQQRHKFEPR